MRWRVLRQLQQLFLVLQSAERRSSYHGCPLSLVTQLWTTVDVSLDAVLNKSVDVLSTYHLYTGPMTVPAICEWNNRGFRSCGLRPCVAG